MTEKSSPKSRTPKILISPSEALLLGLSWEEFASQDAEGCSKEYRFIEILQKRLAPVLPSFNKWHSRDLDYGEIPPDVVWNGNNPNIGLSASNPGRQYFHLSGGVWRVTEWKAERKSLIDCLIHDLWDLLSLSPMEQLHYCTSLQRANEALIRFTQFSPNEELLEGLGQDSTHAIQLEILELVRQNECEHVFEIGCQFGKLVYAIDEFESYVWTIEDHMHTHYESIYERELSEQVSRAEAAVDEAFQDKTGYLHSDPDLVSETGSDLSQSEIDEKESLLSEYLEIAAERAQESLEYPTNEFRPIKYVAIEDAVNSLLSSDLVKLCRHAESLLRDLLKTGNVPKFDMSQSKDLRRFFPEQVRTIPQVAQARTVLWLSFGEVLGVLRDADQEISQVDALAINSRTFPLHASDTPDRVLERLLKIEIDFNSNPSQPPEEVINILGSAIEGLSRRAWPTEFSKTANYKSSFTAILHNRMTSPSNLDRRFASIAMTLYKQYRCPQEHDMDGFHCSIEEARFYFAGVRALIELWKQIQAKDSESRKTEG